MLEGWSTHGRFKMDVFQQKDVQLFSLFWFGPVAYSPTWYELQVLQVLQVLHKNHLNSPWYDTNIFKYFIAKLT